MNFFRIPLVIIAVLAISARAEAGTLYAARAAGDDGELYILNSATGAMITDIGPLNDVTGRNYGMTGLAFHPTTGVLYGSTDNLSEAKGGDPATVARLVTINPATAQVTVIGPFNAGNAGRAATMADIAFDAAGNLYGVGSVGGPQLYSINPATGQATLIGGTGLTSTTGGGLAISSGSVYYGTPTAGRFGTYDSTLGTYTNIANPTKPAGGAYGALSFDGSVLYGLNVGSGSPVPTHLVTIDSTTGTVTDLGVSVDSLDAIAFQVPEPATVALWAIALAALPFRRRK